MNRIISAIGRVWADKNLLDQLLVSGTSFLLQIVLAYWMGLENYGVFSGWQISGMVVLGLQQAFFVSVHQVNYRNGKSTGHHYSMQVFYLNVMTIVPVAALLAAVGWLLHVEIFQPVYIWALTAWLLFDTLRRISITEGKLKAVLWADLLNIAVLGICLSTLKIYDNLTPDKVILSLCLGYILASLLIWQSLAKVVFNKRGLLIVWGMHWKQAKWLVATNMLQMAGSNLFLLCCGWWIGSAALGSLRLVQSIFGLFSLFFQYFENKYLPNLASSSDSSAQWITQMRVMQVQMHRVGLVMSVLVMISLYPIYCFGGWDLVVLVLGFLALQICIVVGIPVRLGIRSQRENKSIFSAYIASSIFSILSAKWLITNWGANGAVVGLCLAQLIMILYWMNILKTKFNFQWKLYM